MSYLRARSRGVNSTVRLSNRLTTFTTPPIRTGDLYIERNESIRGDLDICGNLTIGGDLRAKNFYASGNYYLDNYVLIPAGSIIQSAAINEPDGWFICDGRELNINDYSDLFDAIGYTYGGEEDVFNLPNMSGRVAVGSGGSYDLAETGGETTHTLSLNEIPAHTHSLARKSNSDNGAFDTGDGHQDESSAATTDRADLGPFYTNSTGGSLAHNNMQPYIVLKYLIKI